ncbi:MAG: ankyrin repeat domain-containing protein [Armatimonas sp.]
MKQAILAFALILCLGAAGFSIYRSEQQRESKARRAERQKQQDSLNDGLLFCAKGGNVRVLREELDKGADVNAREVRPLIDPVADGVGKAISLLDPWHSTAATPAPIASQYTALMLAVREGHTEAVRLLLLRGADTHARAPDNQTALSLARSSARPERQAIAQILIQAGADR